MPLPENFAARMAPQDDEALLMQRREDSSLRRLGRLTDMLCKLRNGALTQSDVKNEGTSGDVHESKGRSDIMPDNLTGCLTENAQSATVVN